MHSRMMALTTALSVRVKCSGQCLARCSHLVSGSCVVIVAAIAIMLICPEVKRNKSKS